MRQGLLKSFTGGVPVSVGSYFRVHRVEAVMLLLEDRPTAVALMLAIAHRARATDGGLYNLKAGEALIGDWRRLGYKTERPYRTDVKRLLSVGWVVTRTTDKETDEKMRRGTIATITASSPFQAVKIEKKDTSDGLAVTSPTEKARESDDKQKGKKEKRGSDTPKLIALDRAIDAKKLKVDELRKIKDLSEENLKKYKSAKSGLEKLEENREKLLLKNNED